MTWHEIFLALILTTAGLAIWGHASARRHLRRLLREDDLMAVASTLKHPAGREAGPRTPGNTCPPGLHVHNPCSPPATAELKWSCGCVRIVDGHTGRKLTARPCEQAAHWAAWAKEISQP